MLITTCFCKFHRQCSTITGKEPYFWCSQVFFHYHIMMRLFLNYCKLLQKTFKNMNIQILFLFLQFLSTSYQVSVISPNIFFRNWPLGAHYDNIKWGTLWQFQRILVSINAWGTENFLTFLFFLLFITGFSAASREVNDNTFMETMKHFQTHTKS